MTLPPDSQPPTLPTPRPSPGRSGRGLLIGGVTALLLAGAWAGSTVYSAGQAEAISNRLSGTIDAALRSNNLGKVERHTFARGLSSSTDDVYLVLGEASGPTNGPMKLHLRNRIKHGPLPGLSAVGQAIVDTEVIWDDAGVQAAVDRAFGGKKPTLHTVIGLRWCFQTLTASTRSGPTAPAIWPSPAGRTTAWGPAWRGWRARWCSAPWPSVIQM